MKRRTGLAFAFLLLAAAWLPLAQADHAATGVRAVEYPYSAPYMMGDLAIELDAPGSGEPPLHVGGVRIPVFPEETWVQIHSDKAGSWGYFPARYYAVDAYGEPVASDHFCDWTNAYLPSGTEELWVVSDNSLPYCGSTDVSQTSGVVRAYFFDSQHVGHGHPAPGDGWSTGNDIVQACAKVLHRDSPTTRDITRRVCSDTELVPGAGLPTVLSLTACDNDAGYDAVVLGQRVGACVDGDVDPPSPGGGAGMRSCGDWGWIVTAADAEAGVCVEEESQSGDWQPFDGSPGIGDPNAGKHDCPQGDGGVTFMGGHVAWCMDSGSQSGNGGLEHCSNGINDPRCFWFSATECGPQAVDPTISLFGNTYWICFFPSASAPDPDASLPGVNVPDVGVDPFRCPDQVDPTIYFGGGMYSICADVILDTGEGGVETHPSGCTTADRPLVGYGDGHVAYCNQADIDPDLGWLGDGPVVTTTRCADGTPGGAKLGPVQSTTCVE